MPLATKTPKNLKPYLAHGVALEWAEGDGQGIGDCPFCGKESKWYASIATGQWDCKVCGAKGNVYTFLRMLWDLGKKVTTRVDLETLRLDRRLLYVETLEAWGAVKSPITGHWMLPAHGVDGKLNQLYRYVMDPKDRKMALYATPEINHQVYGVPLYDPKCEEVYVAEGPWDGMASWELLRRLKRSDKGLTETGSEAASILGKASVLAMPSCNVFMEGWWSLFKGKRVHFLYDNDHPRLHPQTRLPTEPGAWAGMKRACQMLVIAEEPPVQLKFLRWGPKDHNPDLPSGYDVRDALTDGANMDLEWRARLLEDLLMRVEPIPEDWVQGRTKASAAKGGTEIEPLFCDRWATVENAWRKAFRWRARLGLTLSVMYACVASTKAGGQDQLWLKCVGPPSSGKTSFAEALSVAKRFVKAISTLTGFYSGFKSDSSGEEDNSLITQVDGKTLIIKDGDTLLQNPRLGEILSQLRDIYDRSARTYYKNKMGRDYEGICMTLIICGTSSLRQLDSSELGERTLDVIIMDEISHEEEWEILLRKAYTTDRAMNQEANGRADSHHEEDMLNAMRLSGGYVTYLRANASQLLANVETPEWTLRKCVSLGAFVAYMRARPSKKQEETAEKEFPARLVSQMTRLAKCLAVVLNKRAVDEDVMARVRQVALDTARGRVLELAKQVLKAGANGADQGSLGVILGETNEKLATLLRFLRKIGLLETFQINTGPGLRGKPRWRLTPRASRTFTEVMGHAVESIYQ